MVVKRGWWDVRRRAPIEIGARAKAHLRDSGASRARRTDTALSAGRWFKEPHGKERGGEVPRFDSLDFEHGASPQRRDRKPPE